MGRAVRQAVQSHGVTWSRNAGCSSSIKLDLIIEFINDLRI